MKICRGRSRQHYKVPVEKANFKILQYPGFLLEAGSRVPAPVYFEQSTRLLKERNKIKETRKNLQMQHRTMLSSAVSSSKLIFFP